jgi:hypothetical protein
MKEVLLRMFFEAEATAAELSADLINTRSESEPQGFRSSANYSVEPMSRTFVVEPRHVLRLVDGLSEGGLTVEEIGTIVFCMEAAPDRWLWDTDTPSGERVADALFWLGTPEVNYPLTHPVLLKIRHYLETGENTLSIDAVGDGNGSAV